MCGDDNRPSVKATMVALAVFYAVSLAVRLVGGVPDRQALRGQAAAATATERAEASRRAPALILVSRLCFRGPRGEPVEYAPLENCQRAPGEP